MPSSSRSHVYTCYTYASSFWKICGQLQRVKTTHEDHEFILNLSHAMSGFFDKEDDWADVFWQHLRQYCNVTFATKICADRWILGDQWLFLYEYRSKEWDRSKWSWPTYTVNYILCQFCLWTGGSISMVQPTLFPRLLCWYVVYINMSLYEHILFY